MSAVWLRVAAELRKRRRAWLAVSLLIGISFAPVLVAVAGARRTASVYPRFLEKQRAWDVVLYDLTIFSPELFWVPDFDALARLPYVADSVRIRSGELNNFDFVGSVDGRYGRSVNTARVIEGRLPHPDSADEVAISVLQKGPGAGAAVGSTLAIKDANGSSHMLTVVGRVISPFDLPPNEFPPNAIVGNGFLSDPALTLEGSFRLDGIALRFRQPQDIERFTVDLRALTREKVVSPLEQRVNAQAVDQAVDLQVIALGLMAGFAGVAVALILLQSLFRQSRVESGDFATLGALGMGRGAMTAVGALRAFICGALGASIAAAISFSASGLFPTGLFRLTEIDPGLRFDPLVHALIPAGIAGFVLAVGALASWRVARELSMGERSTKPSAAGEAAARAGAPAPVVAGVRLAFERGRGSDIVPVRSTLATVGLGFAALTMALLISFNITRLLGTPELYGKTWDTVVGFADGSPVTPDLVQAIAADPRIEAAATADTGAPLRIDDARVGGFDIAPIKGSLIPPILEGRAPRGGTEILVGTRTLKAIGKKVDLAHPQTADVRLEGQEELIGKGIIVGRAVIPPTNNYTGFGQGVISVAKLFANDVEDAPPVTDILVRFASGVDRRDVISSLAERFPGIRDGGPLVGRPIDVVNFGRVSGAPVILAALFGVVGAAALAHALVTAIRRRSRDLAVLKTLGFVRRQLRWTVAVQSSVIVLAAMVVAVPAGIVAGRLLWRAFADRIGVLPSVAVPAAHVAILVPGAIIAANLLATLPARVAARTKPAAILRTE